MIEVKGGSVEEVMHIFGMLRKVIQEYGYASVRDLYDVIGVTGSSDDYDFGWITLNKCNLIPTKDGFILELPKPINLLTRKEGSPEINDGNKKARTSRETILDKAKTCVPTCRRLRNT